MKEVHIFYIQPQILTLNNVEDKMKIFFHDICLNKKIKGIKFIWDEEKPDYLFMSEIIYYSQYQNDAKKLYNKFIKNNPITIFFSGECIEPDFNIFDYAIVYDKNLKYGDRVARIPTMQKFCKSVIYSENQIKTKQQAADELAKKKYFCNFIYSNPDAHKNRDLLYNLIGGGGKTYTFFR